MNTLVWVSVNDKLPRAKQLVWLKKNEVDFPVFGSIHRSKNNALAIGLSVPYWKSAEEREYHTITRFNNKDYFTHWALTHSDQRMLATEK